MEIDNEDYKERICNYSGLLSVEQYMYSEEYNEEWTEEEYLEIAYS